MCNDLFCDFAKKKKKNHNGERLCHCFVLNVFLQQFDYDSSTVRQRIFQDALVSITLPVIKRNLAPTCKEVSLLSLRPSGHRQRSEPELCFFICPQELQGLEQTIYSDYADFVHVENVYEKILLQILDAEASKGTERRSKDSKSTPRLHSL